MKEALKGIQADLAAAREDRDKKRAALDAAQDRIDRLEAAKAFLQSKGSPGRPEPVVKETKRQRSQRSRGVDPTRIGEQPVSLERLMELLPEELRAHGNGGMTQRQMLDALGVQGRGRQNSGRAALARLVEAGVMLRVNDTSSDGTALYALAADEST